MIVKYEKNSVQPGNIRGSIYNRYSSESRLIFFNHIYNRIDRIFNDSVWEKTR